MQERKNQLPRYTVIIITSESRGQSTGVVITQYFGKFSKIFYALITHKVVVIVIVFFFHCLSIDFALFLLKLVSHVFAFVHYYLIYPCFFVLL